MKVVIAGGRDIFIPEQVMDKILSDSGFTPTQIGCGMASGVDICGRNWAYSHGIPIVEFHADWSAHGKAAGPIRNAAMAEWGDALVLIWDGKSKGSRSMLQEAKKRGLQIHQHIWKP